MSQSWKKPDAWSFYPIIDGVKYECSLTIVPYVEPCQVVKPPIIEPWVGLLTIAVIVIALLWRMERTR